MRLIVLLICLISYCHVLAQNEKVVIKDTFTREQLRQLKNNEIPTPAGYYRQMRHYSQLHDTANTEKNLQLTDPHYVMFLGQTPETIEKFIGYLNIHRRTAKAYIERFNKAYDNRSEAYLRFEEMREEDQAMRKLHGQCGDSFTCARASVNMRKTDSTHFEYLHNYIQQHGWPKIEDGSYAATLIAIHDHARHEEYLPYLKQAVLDGTTNMQAYELVVYWLAHNTRELEKFLDTVEKITFKAGFLLHGIHMPGNIDTIGKAMQRFCPARIYYVIECRDMAREQGAMNKVWPQDKDGKNVIERFQDLMTTYCKESFGPPCKTGCWAVSWLTTENEEPRMKIHIVRWSDKNIDLNPYR